MVTRDKKAPWSRWKWGRSNSQYMLLKDFVILIISDVLCIVICLSPITKTGGNILKTEALLVSSCWKHYSTLLHLEDRRFSQHCDDLLNQYISGIQVSCKLHWRFMLLVLSVQIILHTIFLFTWIHIYFDMAWDHIFHAIFHIFFASWSGIMVTS